MALHVTMNSEEDMERKKEEGARGGWISTLSLCGVLSRIAPEKLTGQRMLPPGAVLLFGPAMYGAKELIVFLVGPVQLMPTRSDTLWLQ